MGVVTMIRVTWLQCLVVFFAGISGLQEVNSVEQVPVSDSESCPQLPCCAESGLFHLFSTQRGAHNYCLYLL